MESRELGPVYDVGNIRTYRGKSQSQSALMMTVMVPLCDPCLPLLYRVGIRVVFLYRTPQNQKCHTVWNHVGYFTLDDLP